MKSIQRDFQTVPQSNSMSVTCYSNLIVIVIVKTICNAHKVNAKHGIGGLRGQSHLTLFVTHFFVIIYTVGQKNVTL